ncbi:MAG: CPBP family intramembrane metalloprotease [Candidatus Obscuribacterales bacterium]|nr:CPBP family intramembrane metalloprotease [Candidatus Obscuribacterales bacterium]
MTDDLIAIIACCILGLIAHGSRSQRWLEWVIRVTICVFIGGECLYILAAEPSASMTTNPYGYSLLVGCAIASAVLLFEPGRKLFSLGFTVLEQIVAGRVILALFGKLLAPVRVEAAAQSNAGAMPSNETFKETISENHPVSDSVSESVSPSESLSDSPGPAESATDSAGDGSAGPVASTSASAESLESASSEADSGTEPEASTGTHSEPSTGPSAPLPGSPAGQGAPGEASETPLSDSAQHSPVASEMVMQKIPFHKAFFAERIFVPSSIPHMNALWIYVTVIAFLLTHTELTSGFQMPSIMIPLPVSLDQLFSYNFMGLLMLSACGVGIFVSRKPMETLRRLGLVKPTFAQVCIGIAGIFVTFAYDFLWSTFTHGQEGLGYADKIAHYNEGAFNPSASAGSAGMLASATGICAGIGEEVLSRGALQPVLGILPAAFLHGVLHAQFAHAPVLILQVFGWSAIMGIIRRYTNTTTTIITHVGFNFISTFLFAFNP